MATASGQPESSEVSRQRCNFLSSRCGEGKQVCCPCPLSRCVTIARCQTVQGDYRATKSNNTERKEAAIARLKSLICDRHKKAICCPKGGERAQVLQDRPEGLPGQVHVRADPHHEDERPAHVDASSPPSFLPKQGDGCGTSGNPQRIVGGKTTIPGEFPWAVMVGYSRKRTRTVNKIHFR